MDFDGFEPDTDDEDLPYGFLKPLIIFPTEKRGRVAPQRSPTISDGTEAKQDSAA
jgi:hypothetical protein